MGRKLILLKDIKKSGFWAAFFMLFWWKANYFLKIAG
jgi:hypothetical protein